jgi:hypothetical protein
MFLRFRNALGKALMPRHIRTRAATPLSAENYSGVPLVLPPITNNTISNYIDLHALSCSLGTQLYGALHVAGRYAHVQRISKLQGYWTHGVIEPWLIRPPYAACVSGADPLLPCFVGSSLLAEKLAEEGYRRAVAIGIPFAYVPSLDLQRLPDSLLVCPPHYLLRNTTNQSCPRYIEALLPVLRRFSFVAACIYGGDLDQGNWVNDFRSVGIPVIRGAHPDDMNSLVRMRALFEQFEFMTTPTFGSHVAYALACGVKVSIYGPPRVQQIPEEVWQKDITWQRFPDVRRWADTEEYRQLEQTYTMPWLAEPKDGVRDIAAGELLLGLAHRKRPAELAELFGW